MNTILVALIAVMPIALWGVYFYYKNPRKQPFSEIVKIFLLGTLSIIPAYLFHHLFLDPTIFFIANIFQLEEIVILIALIELTLMVGFILFFMLLFAAMQSLALRVFYKLDWLENFKTVYKRIYHITPLLIFFFLFLGLELILNLGVGIDFVTTLAGSTIIFAVLEEYLKYIINPFLVYKRINSIGSAVINAMYIGLAFAFIENILFFLNNLGSPNFTVIYIYRSIFTTLLHVCASGILGYFYGLSLFSGSMVTNYEIEKSQYNRMATLQNRLGIRKKSVFKNVTIVRGFFLAASVHAVFNLIIFLDQILIAASLITLLSVFIVYLLNLKSTQLQYGLVGTNVMPEEDFEKLRLQISVSQHLKEIRKSQPEL